jgi:pimeloyl-ACP methyl ester carboxylesterase
MTLDLPETPPTVITIHGNGATDASFNMIKLLLKHPIHKYIDFTYNSEDGYDNNLNDMGVLLTKVKGKVFIIAHSLGGIYAGTLAVMFPEKVVGIVTMSTPYGGSEAACMLGMFFPSQLFNDIKPMSKPIRYLHRATIPCPLTAIVTTAGQSSMWQKLNDGVISRESMYDREGAEFIEVEYNHSEVLMATQTVEIIKEALNNIKEKQYESN